MCALRKNVNKNHKPLIFWSITILSLLFYIYAHTQFLSSSFHLICLSSIHPFICLCTRLWKVSTLFQKLLMFKKPQGGSLYLFTNQWHDIISKILAYLLHEKLCPQVVWYFRLWVWRQEKLGSLLKWYWGFSNCYFYCCTSFFCFLFMQRQYSYFKKIMSWNME